MFSSVLSKRFPLHCNLMCGLVRMAATLATVAEEAVGDAATEHFS